MRICVIGAGAIGGLLAGRLAKSGEEVSVMARGPNLEAIRNNGLQIEEADGTRWSAAVRACGSANEAGEQDLVILGVKAHQIEAILPALPALLGPRTMVLSAQNGLPWWYFFKQGGPHEGRRLESVDPEGRIAAAIPAERVIASVVYPAAELVAPGIVQHLEGNRFSLAEIDDAKTERIREVSDAFSRAGFKAPVSGDIRAEIWTKLWGNLSFNPVSALTHATIADLCSHALARGLIAEMMREAQAVGEAFGVRFRIPIEKRLAGAEAVGAHKTSMLQDAEAGRPMEVEALLGSVIELARLERLSTPHLDSVYAMVKMLDHSLQSERARPA